MSKVVSRKGKAYTVNSSRAEKDIEKIDISTDKLLLYVYVTNSLHSRVGPPHFKSFPMAIQIQCFFSPKTTDDTQFDKAMADWC